ncbi:MAG: domain protein putative component of TonB system [Myxococcaceae bacterium]|nr:domain protein putative component of TonB system [Myxococcaceae bacterium]
MRLRANAKFDFRWLSAARSSLLLTSAGLLLPTLGHAQATADAGVRAVSARVDAGTAAVRGADAGIKPASLTSTGSTSAVKTADGGVASPATPALGAEGLPWSSEASAELPSFLQTADTRLKDERPPPSAAQIAALNEMEKEIASFKQSGDSYKDSVVSIVRREYLRQRRLRSEGYERQITQEEKLQDESTDKAIVLFEKFVQQYNDDPTYTPDAMFRLGELYFERAAIDFQNAMLAVMASRDKGVEQADPIKDFTPTIDLYRQLIQRFPDYPRIDGVYYLVGYCLGEMGEPEKARIAWLNLVCANKYDAKATLANTPNEELLKKSDRERKNPSLTVGGVAMPQTKNAPLNDPYSDCVPALQTSRFSSETWLRIGEYHFDYDTTPQGMDYAISAYKRVLVDPLDRNYNLALYKLAWAYYRAFRYPEAVRNFAALVEWSDQEEKRTGRAGSELRAEAVQYLAITFAYDDWNENQVSDPLEGSPTGLQRLQDSALLPQDKPWTPEVYQALGNVWFDEAKYPQAIEVWNLMLKRWPNSPKAPEVQNSIARAYQRANQQEQAIQARALLGSYVEGSSWWNANMDHPLEQRNAEHLAEEAVVSAAVYHHQEAQRLRKLGVQDQDPELIGRAQQEYGLAAQGYRAYIQAYPNRPEAYELQYNLADALFWSENYDAAAREYAVVRDSNLDDKYLSESARRVVESLKRLVDNAVEAKQLELRTEPPAAVGDPPKVTPVPMPALVQRLAQARELYNARVDEAHDTEKVRASYAYNNTLLLYQYGYWTHARERFKQIYETRCNGPLADETGRVAWLSLRNMAVTLGDNAEVERLGGDLREKNCSFSNGAAPTNVDCKDPANGDQPQCLAGADLTNIQYKKAVDVFNQAEKASGDQQVKLYEESATLLLQAVQDEPNHPQAPLALEKAAIALERINRFDSAARLYSRIINEVGPLSAKDPGQQQNYDAILSNAYFRLAFNSNRFFDYDGAIENYRIIADSQRFAKSQDPDMPERREGALINAAKILEYQQQYSQAAAYYQRASDTLKDPSDKQSAAYRVAEMSFKQNNWKDTVTKMQAFIGKYQSDPTAGELVVQASWRIAQARKAMGKQKDYDNALADVVTTYARSGQQPGSIAAEYAAQAKFILADKGNDTFETFAIKPGQPATMKAYVDNLKSQIDNGASQAQQRNQAYDAVSAYRRPAWTIASYARQGRVYEILAKAILSTPFVTPTDMKKQMAKLPEASREDVRTQVEDTVRQLLDQQTRPIECFAVVRYALAARAAKVGSIDNEYTQQAITRLGAYGDERIAECIAGQQAKDSSLQAYTPGEFTRAPRGEVLPMPAGVSPPTLSSESR